jgi:hypothetical protein
LVVVAEAAGITTAHLHATTTSTVAVLALALSFGGLSGTGSLFWLDVDTMEMK